jgi:hypothetical protein
VRDLEFSLLVLLIAALPSFSQSVQPSSSTPADEITLQIIAVSSPSEALAIVGRLQKGEDFTALAKSVSIDSTASEGGFLGKVSPSMLRPELRDALQSVQPGGISPVIKMPTGYAILKVVENSRTADNGAGSSGTPATAATGSVKYTFDLGGLSEMEVGLRNASKPGDWYENPREICEATKRGISAEKHSIEDFLSLGNVSGRDAAAPIDVLGAHFFARTNRILPRRDGSGG